MPDFTRVYVTLTDKHLAGGSTGVEKFARVDFQSYDCAGQMYFMFRHADAIHFFLVSSQFTMPM